jgi:hypothetical protein
MLLRLTPTLGGDGTVYGIIAMNGTGSHILSLFTIDLPHLGGNIQGYLGWHEQIGIIDANGGMTVFPKILVQSGVGSEGVSRGRNSLNPFQEFAVHQDVRQRA